MAKKLISVLAASVILLVGCYEENDATISYSQIPVCSIEAEFDQYAVMKYVVNRDIIIPALEQKFIPQGIAYWVKKDWLILSGYYRPEEKGASATLLAVNATTGKLEGAYSVSDRSGEKIEGHFSGIAVAEKDLYLTHGTYLLQIPLRSLELPSNRGKLFVARKHKIGIKDGSCNYSDRSRNGSYINGKALKGGGSVLFSNSMFKPAPDAIRITDNDNVHFVNCYRRDTGESVGV